MAPPGSSSILESTQILIPSELLLQLPEMQLAFSIEPPDNPKFV